MANFKLSYKILANLEFSSPANFLHQNRYENGLTIGGVYQKYHQNSLDWAFIERIIYMCNNNIKKASVLLYNDKKTQRDIANVFKKNYWDINKLSFVESQIIANEIFLFGVNSGRKNAVKIAQRIVGVNADGIIGNVTLNALNEFNEDVFSIEYDKQEQAYYNRVISKNPKMAINLKGWINRSVAV